MKLLIITTEYPSENNLYANQFVYTRVMEYVKNSIDVTIFIPNKQASKYFFDGVLVYGGGYKEIEALNIASFDKIHVHFLARKNRELLIKISKYIRHKQVDIFMHGYDVLPVRDFLNKRMTLKQMLTLKGIASLVYSEINLWANRRFLKKHQNKVDTLVCVSHQFKERVIHFLKLENKNYNLQVIPNVIDFDLYKFHKRTSYKRILLVRPFRNDTLKYAVDIAIEGITPFLKSKEFSQCLFSIYGDGPRFDEYTERFIGLPNVDINKKFLNQEDLAKVISEHDVMLAPTRDDTQGVLTGQAMASGMVAISSDVEAVPEFLPDGCGYKINNKFPEEISDVLMEIFRNQDESRNLAQNGAKFIREKCSYSETIEKEIELIRRGMQS